MTVQKMNPEIKKRWVEELRSGDYVQGQVSLKACSTEDDTGICRYCCLGVLCQIYADANKVDWDLPRLNERTGKTVFTLLGHESGLPDAVLEWAGLSPEDALVAISSSLCLSDLNDSHCKSFREIADVIEDTL